MALIAFGLGCGLLALEALLQVGALFVQRTRGDVPSGAADGVRILCLGDSNTYGLYLPRDKAYPAQLQEMIAQHPGVGRVEILNAGVPGTNSSKLRNQFARLLEQLRPDVALVMIGTNDGWTLPDPPPREDQASAAEWLWSHSRVFRLAYMIRRAFVNRGEGALTVEFVPPGREGTKGSVRVGGEEIDLSFTGKGSVANWQPQLVENLRAMVATGNGMGVRVALLTYPSEQDLYGRADDAIRRAAQLTGAPLIDLGAVFRPLCVKPSEPPCRYYFVPDQHATAFGNRIVARTVFDGLRANDLLRARPADGAR